MTNATMLSKIRLFVSAADVVRRRRKTYFYKNSGEIKSILMTLDTQMIENLQFIDIINNANMTMQETSISLSHN